MSDPEMQPEPISRMLHARKKSEPDRLGRSMWELWWADGTETIGQHWSGSLDELSTMAHRNGFGGVDLQLVSPTYNMDWSER